MDLDRDLAEAIRLAQEEDGRLEDLEVHGAAVLGGDLSQMEWRRVRLTGCRLVGCDLSGISLYHCAWKDCLL